MARMIGRTPASPKVRSDFGLALRELLAAAGIRENVSLECLKKILDCVTTEEALAFIDAEGKKEDVMEDIMEKIDFYLKKRAAGRLQIECIVYSNTYGLLGMTGKAEELLRRLL